jgi:serine phosphatase RsbU (regulator of sigma subunit)
MIKFHLTVGNDIQELDLEDGEHTVGRAGDNVVQVHASRVSKKHAALRINAGRVYVRDLGSTNGTFVNDERVNATEVEVPPTASISFAGAFLRRDAAAVSTQISMMKPDNVSMVARYNQSEGFTQHARERIMDLSSELFELLASEKETSEIEQAACRFIGRSVSADRVVLMTDHGEGTKVESRSHWTREKRRDGAPLHLSSTIINQVLDRRDAVLVSDVADDPNYVAQHSIMSLNLRSAMAAPLFDNERVRGILYVDTVDPTHRYAKEDLQVLTATANAVAVKLRNVTLERELQTAAMIQRSTLPEHLDVPDGYEIDAYQVMCREVGGDLYHCLRRPNGRTLLALGDVSGKGTPAALAMTAAMVLIGMLAKIGGELLEITKHLHDELFNSLGEDQFITLFLGELDPDTGHMNYVNAGHEPPLIYHTDGTSDALASTGLPIAMMEDAMLEGAETTVRPGDLIAVFSDGIPEATLDGESFLDLDPVKQILESQRNGSLADIRTSIVDTVSSFLGGKPASDDVTLMLLRRAG